jgi:uncharacterized protein
MIMLHKTTRFVAALSAGLALLGAVPALAADWHETVRQFAIAHCQHPAWGYVHSQRDYTLARQLAAADGVTLDDDVLFAASWLHDLAAFAPYAKANEDHSDTAADLVGGILAPTGFPMAKLAAVQAAIRTHMYYRDPQAPEAVYLHDADALDWLGAIGVARIIATVDTAGGQPAGKAAVAMLVNNETVVPARVVSPAGKALVAGRVAEMKAFLAALAAESDSNAPL